MSQVSRGRVSINLVQVELILHCDSMTKLLTLVWVAPRPRTVIVTFFWLAINIVLKPCSVLSPALT